MLAQPRQFNSAAQPSRPIKHVAADLSIVWPDSRSSLSNVVVLSKFLPGAGVVPSSLPAFVNGQE